MGATARFSGERLRNSEGWSVTDWSNGTLSKLSAGTGESFALDAATTYAGKPMLKCVFSSDTSGTLTGRIALSTPIFLGSAKTLQIPVRFASNRDSDGVGNSREVGIWLITTSNKQIRYSRKLAYFEPNRTAVVSVPLGSTQWSYAAGADASTISSEYVKEIRVVCATVSAMNPNPLWIGEVTADARTQPHVVLRFDGQYISQYDMLRPLLLQHGFRGSFAIVTNEIGLTGRMSEAQLQTLYDDGHEIIHHTHTNTGSVGWSSTTRYPDEADITADIDAQWSYLAGKGWVRGIGHAVHGYSNAWATSNGATVQDRLAAALSAAGVKSVSSSTVPQTAIHLQTMQAGVGWYSLYGAMQITNTTTAQQIIDIIDQAISQGEVAIITIHRAVLDGATPGSLEMRVGDFSAWLDYLATQERAGAVSVTRQSQLFDIYS